MFKRRGVCPPPFLVFGKMGGEGVLLLSLTFLLYVITFLSFFLSSASHMVRFNHASGPRQWRGFNRNACSRGILIHKAIEHNLRCRGQCGCPRSAKIPTAEITSVLAGLRNWLRIRGLVYHASEVPICLGFMAGRIDLIFKRVAQPWAGEIIIEIKTGYQDLLRQGSHNVSISKTHVAQVAYSTLLWEGSNQQRHCTEAWLYYTDHPSPARRVTREVIDAHRTSFCRLMRRPARR